MYKILIRINLRMNMSVLVIHVLIKLLRIVCCHYSVAVSKYLEMAHTRSKSIDSSECRIYGIPLVMYVHIYIQFSPQIST